jgi:hypothetical protein
MIVDRASARRCGHYLRQRSAFYWCFTGNTLQPIPRAHTEAPKTAKNRGLARP